MTINIKWICYGAVVLLFLAIPPLFDYTYYAALRWLITISAMLLINYSYKHKASSWGLVFIVIAVIFNPLLPIYLSKSTWIPIDFVGAITFLIFGSTIDSIRDRSKKR